MYKNKGFTFIEVLVAVAVLSLGAVMLHESFFSCLNAFSYSSRRLDTQCWMDEKIWEVQDELIRSGALAMGEKTSSFINKDKNFAWTASINLIDQAQDSYLYRLDLRVCWKETLRNVSLSRAAYVQN